jgi:hypothetical protein
LSHDEDSHVSCGHGKHFRKFCKQILPFSAGKRPSRAARVGTQMLRALRRAGARAALHEKCVLEKYQKSPGKPVFFAAREKCITVSSRSIAF